ncbi:hypothetical protein BU24DRAFT_409550 [Aaosphaeria arxii CBS 175.79]|uniref:Uncharacterized protein n=1 Tax=Aaosphaeria arxii CBS 175.79 TaxID=1450172 RepID=A0A6A5XU56_9PLEO|nr:uncharacterized protein BU24DRAFT_409550 [Aaosphaeria arxii CBS 175.79]KAF2016449.1 hypothetical protein BU24DRAFT_409550 [Aaosphaeria arxii CBS 175.79]
MPQSIFHRRRTSSSSSSSSSSSISPTITTSKPPSVLRYLLVILKAKPTPTAYASTSYQQDDSDDDDSLYHPMESKVPSLSVVPAAISSSSSLAIVSTKRPDRYRLPMWNALSFTNHAHELSTCLGLVPREIMCATPSWWFSICPLAREVPALHRRMWPGDPYATSFNGNPLSGAGGSNVVGSIICASWTCKQRSLWDDDMIIVL